MTGVEILAMEEVATKFGFNWSLYIFLIVISVVVGGLMVGLLFFNEFGARSFLIGIAMSIIISGLIGLIPSSCTLPKEYETQYKVTISDEVQMNDFLAKYEIIDQEGKIYTVRERNDGERKDIND